MTTLQIEVDGPLRFEFVRPGTWAEIRRRWRDEHGMELPASLKRFGVPRDCRVLLEPVTVTITWPSSRWIQVQFLPGWITDLASVPWFFRSVVDNDDTRLIIAAMVHDYNFSTHTLTFDETNDLFREMAVALGYPRPRARVAYWAVSSVFGRRRWGINGKKRDAWTRETTRFASPR